MAWHLQGLCEAPGPPVCSQGRKSLLAAPNPDQCLHCILQGEMWPNRCSAAIDEANSRLQELCETADHLHFLDLGQVSLSIAPFLPVALLFLAARSSTHLCK